MRVLWLTNILFPYPSEKMNVNNTVFGGWLLAMFDRLSKNDKIEMCVVSNYKGNDLKQFNDGKTTYYVVPNNKNLKYNKKTIKYYKKILQDFKPDIVHIHGTEYPRGLELINSCNGIPIVTSIQGLVDNISKVYYGNISVMEILKNITFRDFIKFNTIFDCKRDFAKRGKYEKEIIKKSNYIIGRTTWDYANVVAINDKIKYYHLNEQLRNAFYMSKKWDIKDINRYTLFCSQSSYPIKGLHILLESIKILKNKYKDVKLYISGMNIIDDSSLKSRIKQIGYGKYIKKLINRYDIQDNIEFVGYLTDKQIADRLLKTHVFVSPSFIENESNSLSEAMILGVPSVGSYVGGVADRILNNVTGFHYPVTEPAMLAHSISKIFDNDKLAISFSKKSIDRMEKIVDRKKNDLEIIKIYNDILEKKNEKN